MKNKHFLLLVSTIAFFSFYVPVAVFTTYIAYIPLWILPAFWIVAFFPFWFNEFMWIGSFAGSDTYLMFHQLYEDGKNWKNKDCNLFLVVFKFTKWWITKFHFWGITLALTVSLYLGYTLPYSEDLHPFEIFYYVQSVWWIVLTWAFLQFKERVKYGVISYGKRKRDKYKTHFMPEWHEENMKLMKNKRV
jgi:hypothetical protein